MNDQKTNKILLANQLFYDAFAKGKFAGVEKLWSQSSEVSVTHPGQPTIHGYESVMESWQQILKGGRQNAISCKSAMVFQYGNLAYVTCIEIFSEAELIAVNIFVEENGEWRMVYHQAGTVNPKHSQTIRVLH